MERFAETQWILPCLLIFLSLIPLRAFITIVHEAGHAIAMALLTKERIVVFLGSYGDRDKCRRLSIGRFELWIRINPLRWKGGLCIAQASNIPARSRFLITLAGPIASLLLAVSLIAILFIYKPDGPMGALLLIFSVLASLSFLANMVPKTNTIMLEQGNMTYNDGTQLRMMLDARKLPAGFSEAVGHLREKRYDAALPVLEGIITEGTKNPELYRMVIAAHIGLKNYTIAHQWQKEQIAKIGNINDQDRITLAVIKTHTGNYEEAVAYYNHLFLSGGRNKFNLNNLGYTLNLMQQYEAAIPYLDEAIAIDPDFAHAYSNRAYSKIKLRLLEDSKADNDRSLQLDDTEAYAYRNAGLYYLERERYEEAVRSFEKCLQLDPATPAVYEYLNEAQDKLERYRE